MAVCDICNRRYGLRRLNQRLAIPEYRAMIGFWPWVTLRVCDACLAAHDRDFLERLRLLASEVLENDEPVTGRVCLGCGTVDSAGPWYRASKWVDSAGRPVRRARFWLCDGCRDAVYIDGIVVSSNLTDAERMGAVLEELPVAGSDLLDRVEHWRPEEGSGPPDAQGFAAGRGRDESVAEALRFWQETPDGLEARASWLGPVRKDYRMRYRLDLVRDSCEGCREVLVVVRTEGERFATYRMPSQPSEP